MEKRCISWERRLADLIRFKQERASRGNRNHLPEKRQRPRQSRILEQIKFYLSDANLRRDKYMHSLFQADSEGWLSFSELLKFPILNRMRLLESEILSACKRSDFFIIDEPNRRLKRNFHLHPNIEIELQLIHKSVPHPEELGSIERRTIYVDMLPRVMDRMDLQEQLLLQFPNIHLNHVSVPRHAITGESYGCAFMELGTDEEAQLVLRKWRSIDSDKFDAVNGRMGRAVRVISIAKYKALRRAFKDAKRLSVSNRLGYAEEYNIDSDIPSAQRYVTKESEVGSEDSCGSQPSSSLLFDSEMNSLEHESVDARRCRNPSSIRSNSVIFISELPPTTATNIRVWLSHSCAVQFLDYKEGETVAHARLASRRERDFFLKDFERSKIPILGTLPRVRPLSETECTGYFEAERQRRRCLIQTQGHPDTWEPPRKRSRKSDVDVCVKTKLYVDPECKHERPKNGIAFTDSLAGNTLKSEPGTSILYGIKKNRNFARNFLLQSSEGEKEQVSPGIFLCQKNGVAEEKVFKKTRRGRRGGKRYNRA